MTRRNDHIRVRLLGWVFALLALLGQVAGAAALPECCQGMPALGVSALGAPALGEICGIDHSPGSSGPASPHRHQPDCAMCPYCTAMIAHAVVVFPAPVLPVPHLGVPIRMAAPPPARAPPGTPYRPGKPRGPPALT